MNAAKKMELRNDSLFELIKNKLKEIKIEYKCEKDKEGDLIYLQHCMSLLNDRRTDIIKQPIKKLPESWEELKCEGGWYTDGEDICKAESGCFSEKDDFETKKQALSSLAYAQLTRLLKAYNGDWTPDFTNGQYQYCIYRSGETLKIDSYQRVYFFIALETDEKAEHFLKHHEALIKQFFQM